MHFGSLEDFYHGVEWISSWWLVKAEPQLQKAEGLKDVTNIELVGLVSN